MLSLLSLPSEGNNWRQGLWIFSFFLFFFCKWRNENWEKFQTFAFVVPRCVMSDMRLLTGEIVVLFHLLSDVDTETFYCMACRGTCTTQMEEKKNTLFFHQCHSPTTQSWVKIFASFSTIIPQDHIPRACSLFITQSYCFTLLSRVKALTSL